MKKDINLLIEEFLNDVWDMETQTEFLEDIGKFMSIYDPDKLPEQDKQADDLATIVFIRSAFFLSKICEKYAGKMCKTNIKYPKLWRKMGDFINEDQANEKG